MRTGHFDVVLHSVAGIPLAFYGYAFQKAWISIESVPSTALVLGPDLIPGGILNALVAIVLGILALKFDSHRFRRVLLYVGTGLQLADAALLITVPFVDYPPEVFAFATAIAGAGGVVLMSALWVDLYSLLNPVRVAYLNAVAIILAQALIFIVEGNELSRVLAVLAVIPIITACLYIVGAHSGAKENPPAKISKAKFLFPYKAVLFIAVYSLAYGVAAVDASVISARYTAVVPAAIVLLFVFLNTKRFNISILIRMALPLMLSGFLLISFIPGELHAASSFMLYSGFATMEMLLLLMVCTISYSSGTSAIWLFGILGGTQFLMRGIGTMVGGFAMSSLGDAQYTVLNIAAIVAVVLVSLTLMSEKSLFSFWGAKSQAGTTEDGSIANEADSLADDSLEIRINTLSASYALTDRETEVLYLVVKGKTNNQIARDMFISIGTVKAHLYHIYQKLGILTRKELFALLDVKK